MQCQTCNEVSTVISVRTWVQKACDLKNSPVLLACDGEGYPEVGISNVSNQNATYTNTYRTDCRDSCKKVVAKRTLGDPPDKTLDLVVAADCAGYNIGQLTSGSKLNVYLEFICCCGKGATDFSQVKNYAVIRGVDLSVGYSIPSLTNIDGSDIDVQYSFSGVPFDEIYHNSATTANVIVSDSGGFILSSIFLDPVTDCNDKSQCDGEQKWATVDNQGQLSIYNGSGTPDVYNVPGLAGTPIFGSRHFLVQVGDKLYIFYSSTLTGEGYACVTLGTNCVPQGDWTNNPIVGITFMQGACPDGNGNIIAFGQFGTDGVILSIAPNGSIENILTTPTGIIRDVAKCGKNMVAVSDGGGVFKNTGCAGVFEPLMAPAGAADIAGAEVFGPNAIMVITEAGETYCTVDCAQTPWEPLPAANQPISSNLNDVEFYDELFGLSYGPAGVSVTTNGGYTWSSTFMDIPAGFRPYGVEFDCENPGCAILYGRGATGGEALLMKPENC